MAWTLARVPPYNNHYIHPPQPQNSKLKTSDKKDKSVLGAYRTANIVRLSLCGSVRNMDPGLHPHAALSERAPAGGEGQSPRSGPQSSESQLSTTSGQPGTGAVHREGYDFEFVPPLDPQYECPICTLGLRNPSQTKCGHRFCEVCIHIWIRYVYYCFLALHYNVTRFSTDIWL